MKICSKCKEEKSLDNFDNKGKKSECKACIKIRNRKYAEAHGSKEKFIPIVNKNAKQCAKCRKIKDLSRFSAAKRGRLGKSAYCKPCASDIQLEKYSKEERRLKTQKYRDNNREWWRFLHRINQFNRKNKVKLASDGSVTPEVMKDIYNTEICYYCKKEISEDLRTCDHKIPVNKQGKHSKDNLVMACVSCNCSKTDKTEQEFFEYLEGKYEL